MKPLVKVAVIIGAVLVAGLLAAFLARNVIAAAVVRGAATYTLGVPVDVGSVDLAILDKQVTLKDFTVGNPPGYKQPHILTAGQIHVALNAGESTTSKIVVEEVTLDKLGVWYIGKGGKNNVSDLMEKMHGSGGKETKESGGATVEILIKKIVLTDLQAHYSMDDGEGTTLPTVKRIELANVSTKSGADGIYEQLSGKIFDIAMQAAFDSVGKELPGELSKGIGKGLESAGVALGEAAKAVGKAAEGATKAAGDAVKGIGDIFGGGKK